MVNAADMARLRGRSSLAFARRLLAVTAATFWVPLLFILIERGIPTLALLGYVAAVLAVTAVMHAFQTLRNRGGTALVPVAIRLQPDRLQLDVRNVGNARATSCDVSAWLFPVASASTSFEESARRLPEDGRPHFSQRIVALAPGEEVLAHELTRAAGAPNVRPGLYHVKWRTASTDRHERRSSLEGWTAVEVE